MGFYEEMQDVAAELLTEFGVTAILTKAGSTVSDPDEAWNNSAQTTPTTEAITAAVVPVSDLNDVKFLSGLGAYSKAGNILVAAKDMTNDILPGDFVTHDGDKWKIVKAVPIKPATITVMYNCVGIL